MFDYLRNLTKSAAEKQQETLNAYLDDALSPQKRQLFEQQMAADADLRREVEQRQALQMQLREMPRRRVPRNFTLGTAVYGRPQRQPLFQFYPAMRAATVLTAFFFVLAIGAELFLTGQGGRAEMSAPAQDIALMVEEPMEEALPELAAEAPVAAEVVEVTRVVTETVVEESAAVEIAAEEAAEEAAVEGEAETMAAEAADMAEAPLPAAEEPPGGTTTDDEAATDTAEMVGGAAGPESEMMPTPSPASTLAAPVDATQSTVPRPEAEATVVERAVTAVPTSQSETAANSTKIEATAVPLPPQVTREPISSLRWLQIGLGVLLVVLGTAVFYVRRQS